MPFPYGFHNPALHRSPFNLHPVLSRRAGLLLALPVAAILAAYVLWPSVDTISLGFNEANLERLFGRWRSAGVRALVNSVGISLGTVALGGILGTSLAWAFFGSIFRSNERCKLALPFRWRCRR